MSFLPWLTGVVQNQDARVTQILSKLPQAPQLVRGETICTLTIYDNDNTHNDNSKNNKNENGIIK